jgi:hypothetical protein
MKGQLFPLVTENLRLGLACFPSVSAISLRFMSFSDGGDLGAIAHFLEHQELSKVLHIYSISFSQQSPETDSVNPSYF